MASLNKLDSEIKAAKAELERLYSLKGRTDLEVLRQGEKVDELLNEYNRMVIRASLRQINKLMLYMP